MLPKSSSIRSKFPQLSEKIHGYPLIYLDTAATSLKPQCVIDKITHFYSQEYATVHRALYTQSQKATHAFQLVREKICAWIGAKAVEEILFSKGTTDSLNHLALLLEQQLNHKDVILVTEIEHHSNLLPWQILSKKTGATLKAVRVNDKGEIDLEHLEEQLSDGNVKLFTTAHVSNITGGIHPIQTLSALVHRYGAWFNVDGAQAAGQLEIDVQKLGVDFYHFSGHKIYGPTGIGVFYGKKELLDSFFPVYGGGDMVDICDLSSFTPQPLPLKFESGTPHIAGVIGLGAAIDFLQEHEADRNEKRFVASELKKYLLSIEDIELVGAPENHAGIFSFTCKKGHPLDIALLLDSKGVALRTGHLCSQPALQRFCRASFLRASIGIYNTIEDVERFIEYLCSALSKC